LDNLRDQFKYNQDISVSTNPYYFNAAFSGLVVVPAAHNFIINFMSNHSVEEPNSYLDGYNLKSFFGVTGEPGNFVWNVGQEKIPGQYLKFLLTKIFANTKQKTGIADLRPTHTRAQQELLMSSMDI